jgi:hypothetical protein
MCIGRNSIVFIVTYRRTCHEEAQRPSHVVNGGKVPNSEDNTINEDERSNQVAKYRTLPDFHEDDAKNEVEELSQEVEALIKVY